MKLREDELEELARAFADLINYESDDPTDPINPLTYEDPDGDNCLHVAASRNDHRAAGLLLKAGVDVNCRGDMGSTPLHYAVKRGSVEVIRVLLEHGASKTLKNEFGVPAMPADTEST